MKKILCAVLATLLLSGTVGARNVRATELSGADWKQLSEPSAVNLTVEFRKGDEIPVHFSAVGDFFESKSSESTVLAIKQNFWLRQRKNQVFASLDGEHFRGLNEMVTGSLSANSNADESGGPVNTINVLLSAFLK